MYWKGRESVIRYEVLHCYWKIRARVIASIIAVLLERYCKRILDMRYCTVIGRYWLRARVIAKVMEIRYCKRYWIWGIALLLEDIGCAQELLHRYWKCIGKVLQADIGYEVLHCYWKILAVRNSYCKHYCSVIGEVLRARVIAKVATARLKVGIFHAVSTVEHWIALQQLSIESA